MPVISEDTFNLFSELLTQHIKDLLSDPDAYTKEDIDATRVAAVEMKLNFDELVEALGNELQVRLLHERMKQE